MTHFSQHGGTRAGPNAPPPTCLAKPRNCANLMPTPSFTLAASTSREQGAVWRIQRPRHTQYTVVCSALLITSILPLTPNLSLLTHPFYTTTVRHDLFCIQSTIRTVFYGAHRLLLCGGRAAFGYKCSSRSLSVRLRYLSTYLHTIPAVKTTS